MEINRIEKQFDDCIAFLMRVSSFSPFFKIPNPNCYNYFNSADLIGSYHVANFQILSFKLNVGQFPHLADLVTRINYNHFYMSHNGSLINAPGSNTVPSKSGKLFAGQRDWKILEGIVFSFFSFFRCTAFTVKNLFLHLPVERIFYWLGRRTYNLYFVILRAIKQLHLAVVSASNICCRLVALYKKSTRPMFVSSKLDG